MTKEPLSPLRAVEHLRPDIWTAVNVAMVAKAIAELTHELLLTPTVMPVPQPALAPWRDYSLAADGGRIEYRFRAQVLALEHWHLDPNSLRKIAHGHDAPVDAMTFFVEFREPLGISPDVLPTYLHEIASTLCGAAFKRAQRTPTAAALAAAAFQEIETGMIQGHPIFVANNARIGFDAADYRAYAPECANPVALLWLAGNKAQANVACVGDLSYATLMREELGEARLAAFNVQLRQRGRNPDDYVFFPVHPWQWNNRLAQLFAADIASGDLIPLGDSDDLYQAQQSIRTFYNITHPHKRYVKTALSILNMGFMRGLSATLSTRAAAVNDWVSALVRDDQVFAQHGFRLLREVAFIGYRHRHYQRASTKRVDPYKEMLAALWRESPQADLRPGQRLMTMAALMHGDASGAALLPALIHLSGLGVDAWMCRYLRCYLTPLLHAFYAHNLVFTPHCENVILVLENDRPVGVFLKDLAEDIGVLNPDAPLPAAVGHLALRVPEDVMTLSIFTDAFDCVFRFLAQILHEQAAYPQESFWRLVADCVTDYQTAHPALADRFRRYDLFAPVFIRNCLNRLQLVDNQEMVDLNAPDPVDSLQFVGTLANPITPFAKPARATKESHDAA